MTDATVVMDFDPAQWIDGPPAQVRQPVIEVRRPDDLLVFDLRFENLQLETRGRKGLSCNGRTPGPLRC